METVAKLGVAIALLATGSGMAFYEWIRTKAGRPILGGRDVRQLYWIAYLAMLVLGLTVFISAIVR